MEFPDLGSHCALSSCKRLDFLPVKCPGCKELFCGTHFPPSDHACRSAAQWDARVPVCPLCDGPVPLRRRGEAPDAAVSAHIDAQCQSDPAKKRRKVFDKRCAFAKCKKKEMIPLNCQDCGRNFCLTHRHPLDHKCEGKASKVNPSLDAALKRQQRQGHAASSSAAAEAKRAQLESDEALARALQESLRQEGRQAAQEARAAPMSQEELDRLMALQLAQGVSVQEASQQQQQQRSSNSSCTMS